MRISNLIEKLKWIQDGHGDLEVVLEDETPTLHCDIFVVPEEFGNDEGTSEEFCVLRWWPY